MVYIVVGDIVEFVEGDGVAMALTGLALVSLRDDLIFLWICCF